MKEINFDSFWKLKNNHLTAFFAYWEKSHRNAPDAFPNFMGEGDWEEQFGIFIDTVYNPSVDKNGFYKA